MMEATLNPERFQAAWQRGATLDLFATAKEQLAELAGANISDVSNALSLLANNQGRPTKRPNRILRIQLV
jgi:hypothetical protein